MHCSRQNTTLHTDTECSYISCIRKITRKCIEQHKNKMFQKRKLKSWTVALIT